MLVIQNDDKYIEKAVLKEFNTLHEQVERNW